MIFQNLKRIALTIVTSGLLLTGAGVLARVQAGGQEPQPPEPSETLKAGVFKPASKHFENAFSKPEPSAEQVEAQLHRELVEAARLSYLGVIDRSTRSSPERIQSASRLLMEAERDAAGSPEGRLKSFEGHLERMKELARQMNDAAGTDDASRAEARAFVAQAGLLLSEAKRHKPPAGITAESHPASSAAADGPGKDPRSLAILAKLEEPIAMSFPNETPLEDLLKYIKQATQGSSGSGIPIYVDPLGLKDADKAMTSPIALDLEGVPLRRTLQLALNQLGLGYFVDDGILVITSLESADEQSHLPPSRVEPSMIMKKEERFEHGEMDIKEMKDFASELTLRRQVLKLIGQLRDSPEPGHADQATPPKTDPLEPLIKDIKELVGQLKAERVAGKKGPSK